MSLGVRSAGIHPFNTYLLTDLGCAFHPKSAEVCRPFQGLTRNMLIPGALPWADEWMRLWRGKPKQSLSERHSHVTQHSHRRVSCQCECSTTKPAASNSLSSFLVVPSTVAYFNPVDVYKVRVTLLSGLTVFTNRLNGSYS